MQHDRISYPLALPSAALLGLACAIAVGGFALPAVGQDLPLRFDAVAVNMSNVGPRGQARLDIVVNRWSTDEERSRLMAALQEQSRRGDRQLADALFGKESVGTIREVQSLAYDLRYARAIPNEDGGQQIVLATDRRIGFAEAWRSTRTMDYNVTLIFLDLDAKGRGQGQLMLGAEFRWDEAKNQIIIENFASEPIRLTQVRMR